MKYNPLPQHFDTRWLFQLATQLPLSSATVEAALNKLGILPDKSAWRQWLTLLFLGLGSGLFLSGILFFFAYNWEDMHRFSRFSVLLVGIVSMTGTVLWVGLDNLFGKLLLTAAAVLTGVLLATFGMVYQTGADSFMLFRGWAILILPWVLVSRFQPLWLIALLIVNIAFFTWIEVTSRFFSMQSPEYFLIFCLSMISIIVLLLREFTTLIHPTIAEARWFPRLVIFWLLLVLSYIPIVAIIEGSIGNGYQQILLLFYLFILATLSYYALMIRHDLLVLALVLLSIIVVFLVSLIQVLDPIDDLIRFFIMGLVIAGVTTIASKLLRSVARKWQAEEALS